LRPASETCRTGLTASRQPPARTHGRLHCRLWVVAMRVRLRRGMLPHRRAD
jgi:hypothetical protein